MNEGVGIGWWVGGPHDDGVEGREEERGWDATALAAQQLTIGRGWAGGHVRSSSAEASRLPCRDSVTRHGSIRGRRTVPIADVHSIAYISHACSIRAEDRDAALDGNLWLGNFTCNMNT